MKKSLVALAVLAASGASFAQSSVTLYGIADMWFGGVKTDNGMGVSNTTTKLESGGVNESRWGLKGSEDLGGGLKANFKLEQGFALDTGTAAAGQAFSREAYVGFSGGFGEVKLGKVWTAYDDVSAASNAVFDSKLAPMNWVFKSVGYAGNPGNTVYYSSPTMGGLAGAVSYSLDEKVVSAPKVSSLNLTYGAGPVAVQLGYQEEDIANTALTSDAKFLRLGGSYNFGIATAKVALGKVANVGYANGYDATEWQIGADMPLGSALTLSVSYAKSEDSKSTGFEESRKGFGVAAAYSLSKRTFLYGGFNANRFTQQFASDRKVDILAVGVQHKF